MASSEKTIKDILKAEFSKLDQYFHPKTTNPPKSMDEIIDPAIKKLVEEFAAFAVDKSDDRTIKDILKVNLSNLVQEFQLIPTSPSKSTDEIINSVIEKINDEFAALAIDESEKTRKANLKELHTLEYTQAAERYENIYKGIWTNFSYMTAVTGAILVFGNNFYPNAKLIAFLATLPLLFWYLISFVPLNRYGYKVLTRLGKIENDFNDKLQIRLEHFSDFGNKSDDVKFFSHLKHFLFYPRVGPLMLGFASIILFFSIWFGYQYVFDRSPLLEPFDFTVSQSMAKRLLDSPTDPTQASAATANQTNTNSNTNNNSDRNTNSNANKISNTVSTGNDIANKEIYELIKTNLSEKTIKLLKEFEKSNSANANELKFELRNDFNTLIEGAPICTSEIKTKSPTICDEELENYMLTNRKVLVNLFPNEIRSSDKFSRWFIIPLVLIGLIILQTFLYEFYGQIIKRIFKFNSAKQNPGS